MRRSLTAALCWAALTSTSFAQQWPGERPAPPSALDGLQPTTTAESPNAPPVAPQRASQRVADPWQLVPTTPGIQLSPSTTLYPGVTLGTFYDDNVFASPNNRRGSWGYVERPELGLRSSGQNYIFEAAGFVEGRQYQRFSSDNQINASVGMGGTFQPDATTQLVGRVRYIHAHEDRGVGESNLAIFDRPVAYDNFEASGAFNKRFGRLWTSLGLADSIQRYQDPTIIGLPIDQSYRNGDIAVGTVRVGYAVAPLTSLFVEWAGNRRNFRVDNFDSRGYRAVGGVLLEPGVGARVRGEVYAGYMYQDYSGATFQTVSTFTYGGSLAFLLAPRWTGVVEGRRVALESALNPTGVLNGGVSLVESIASARLDYALLPNLFVGAGVSYIVDEFKGANRTDRSLSPLVSVKYLVDPRITLGFDYRNLAFDSSGFAVPGYRRNVYLFTLNARI